MTVPPADPPREGAVTAVIGLAGMPPSIAAIDGLLHPSYADLFTIRANGAGRTPPASWARIVLEETASGRSAPRLWRALGLRLGPRPSPDHVQGWRIADQAASWIRIETHSWYVSAHAVVSVDPDALSLGLFVRYDRRPIAPLIWPPVGVVHRRAVPTMLRQAVALHAPG